jgi:hypothetical protein
LEPPSDEKRNLVQNSSTFWVFPYRVQSSVFSLSLSFSPSLLLSLSIFREFICALAGNAIKITDPNFIKLEEFCFTELAAKLSNFPLSINFTEREAETEAEDVNARGRIAILEEKANQHSNVNAMLQNEITQLSTDFGCFVDEVSSLRSAAARIWPLSEEISVLKTSIEEELNDSVVEQL